MQAENLRLYERLSIAGLLGELHDIMKTIRPTISRNTIRLAFVRGGTTRLRRRILQEGRAIWELHRDDEATTPAEPPKTNGHQRPFPEKPYEQPLVAVLD